MITRQKHTDILFEGRQLLNRLGYEKGRQRRLFQTYDNPVASLDCIYAYVHESIIYATTNYISTKIIYQDNKSILAENTHLQRDTAS